MKDPAEEFEKQHQNLDEALGRLGNIVAQALNPYRRVQKPQVQAKPQAQAQSLPQNTSNECEPWGTQNNNSFQKETGSKAAAFGPQGRGEVKDISDFDVAPRALRCYDLKADKLGIAWLFNGTFIADKIWGKPGQVYFQGTWKGGEFKGILMPGSKFEGGLFKGKHFNKAQDNGQGLKGGFRQLDIRVPGLEVDGYANLIDGAEMQGFLGYIEDIKAGKFLRNMSMLKKLVRTGEVDGYGPVEDANFIFPVEGAKMKIARGEKVDLLKYLVDFKNFVIDNIYNKNKQPDTGLQKSYIAKVKQYLQVPIGVPVPQPGIKRFSAKAKGIAVDTNINILNTQEAEMYAKFQKDVLTGELLSKLSVLRKYVQNSEIDGYGKFPTLKYLFDEKGQSYSDVDKAKGELLQYFVDFKHNIIDNFITAKGKPARRVKIAYINQMRSFLGLPKLQIDPNMAPAPVAQPQAQAQQQVPAPANKGLGNALRRNLKEEHLSLDWIFFGKK